MYQGKVELTIEDIYQKQFKFDAKGYRPQEVDGYLDIIMKDYDTMNNIIKELKDDKKELIDENMQLKQKIRELETKVDVLKDASTNEITSVDILKRLSSLEKIVYGKE